MGRKIEFVLDDVFEYFGLDRVPVSAEIEEETASDEDY